LQQALSLYQQSSDLPGQTKTLKALGHTYYYQDQYEKALTYYKQSLDLAQQTHDLDAESRALLNVGNVVRELGRFGAEGCPVSVDVFPGNTANCATVATQAALAFYIKSLEIIREQSRSDKETRAFESTVLATLGVTYALLGQTDKGAESSQQALVIARDIQDHEAEVDALRSLGFAYLADGKASQSITAYQEALAVAREVSEWVTLATLNVLGNTYALFQNLPQAIEVRQQTLALARKLGDSVREGESFQKLAVSYYLLGEYDKVLDHAQQALEIAKRLPRLSLQQEALNSLGEAYQSQGKYQPAVESYEESLKIARTLNDQLAQKRVLVQLLACYTLLGQYDRIPDYQKEIEKLPPFEELMTQMLPGGSRPAKSIPPNTQSHTANPPLKIK
jgi:tetratricopeptide (TPR) repeat protein